MNSRMLVAASALALCFGAYSAVVVGAPGNEVVAQAGSGGYRVGDTLAPAKPRAPAGGYEDILWEALLPEGWSVEKIMQNLNLSDLSDNDPKAREALQKIREMWDNAPVNAKVDGKRIRIPGFAVPLDGERDKAKEFLLVPYFGACIHSPAPPANQVLHAVVNPSVGTVKLAPAIWISGTLRTVRADTKLAVTGYEITVDKVEPYQLDSSPFGI